MTETFEIKMPAKKLLTVLFLQYGRWWAVAALAGVILFVILGVSVNIRFLMVALIWIFLLVPLVVAFLYFYYGMDPLTAFNAIPHKLIFEDDNHIKVRISKIEKENENEMEVSREENYNQKEYIASGSNFRELKYGSDYVLLFFNKEGLLWVPMNAFPSMENFKQTIQNYTSL